MIDERHMNLDDLRRRLRRLGVVRAANLTAARLSPRARYDLPAPHLDAVSVTSGVAWVSRQVHPLTHRHGTHALGESVSAQEGWRMFLPEAPDVHETIFLDTETTGLLNGAGTLVFLVGLGYFEGEHFVVEQLFLRDPMHEAAMLELLDRRLAQRAWLITFNGQSFDVPLLQSRFLLSRLPSALESLAHLDLLLVARAIWRGVLPSCRLSALEQRLLSVRRGLQDVPSALIPQLYREYVLRGSGELTTDMQRVMYHNAQDVLSMVALWTRIGSVLAQPESAHEHQALGQHYERLGDLARAEQHYRAAVASAEQMLLRNQKKLARLLKRQGRHDEAFHHWRSLAAAGDLEGVVESARHLEQRLRDPCAASALLEQALTRSADGAQRRALERRLRRTRRRCQVAEGSASDAPQQASP